MARRALLAHRCSNTTEIASFLGRAPVDSFLSSGRQLMVTGPEIERLVCCFPEIWSLFAVSFSLGSPCPRLSPLLIDGFVCLYQREEKKKKGKKSPVLSGY